MRFPDIATKRLLLLVVVELALVSALAYLLVVLSSGPRLRVENFKRIEHGMSRAAVTAILGRPSVAPPPADEVQRIQPAGYAVVRWSDEGTKIDVTFNASGEVARADRTVDEGKPRADTLFGRFKELWNRLSP
jgi:outer membrane protein assembly factor BamE (lipoprotein component of BamABCDE complex)